MARQSKALTLHQPWASLVALRVKKIETRSWSTNYRGPLAIHAGATVPSWVLALNLGGYEVTKDNPRRSAPAYLLRGPMSWPYRLPLGAVVATCELVDVVPTNDLVWGDEPGWRHEVMRSGADHVEDVFAGREQRPFGDFSPGRFAWLLDNIVPIRPVPARGAQRIWNWQPDANPAP